MKQAFYTFALQKDISLLAQTSGGDKRPKSQIPREFDMFGSRAKYQAS
jgi:hypothetical protein